MSDIEITLGGVKAVYDGWEVIKLVDMLTGIQYGIIDVWDYENDKPRIEKTAHDVWIEMDMALHPEEQRNQR